MRCNKFGIGLIVLSITLFLGITISEFFKLRNISEIEVFEANVEILDSKVLKNCEPVDKDLKYQILPAKEGERNYMKIDKDQEIILIPVPAIPKKNNQSSEVSTKDAPKDLEKTNSELHIPLPQENYAENKNLLHKEICREIENGRK